MNRRTAHAHEGQSMVLIALILTVLTPFVFLSVEVTERYYEAAQIEDALQNAVRVGVLEMEYESFAKDRVALASDRAVLEAKAAFIRNLETVRGLHETPDAVASQVRWTPHPEGGVCRFADGSIMTFDRPALCAEVRPELTGVGVGGWGNWRPLVRAGSALDRLDRPASP
ncbi:hypothetical protein [Roseiflexus castenholzii]|uniref:hypothetical protein n=1 Tax=Roseiflexus castenholzii TaxID=120962 RepID=UPI003C7D4753